MFDQPAPASTVARHEPGRPSHRDDASSSKIGRGRMRRRHRALRKSGTLDRLNRDDAKPTRSKVVLARVFQGAQASRRRTPVLLGHAPSLLLNSEWPWKRAGLCGRPSIAVGSASFRLSRNEGGLQFRGSAGALATDTVFVTARHSVSLQPGNVSGEAPATTVAAATVCSPFSTASFRLRLSTCLRRDASTSSAGRPKTGPRRAELAFDLDPTCCNNYQYVPLPRPRESAPHPCCVLSCLGQPWLVACG